MFVLRRVAGIFFFVFFSFIAMSQDILTGRDLRKINVDLLTNEQIIKYREQVKRAGISEAEAEQIALQRGMPLAEITKLKARLAQLESGTESSPTEKHPVTTTGNQERTTDTAGTAKPQPTANNSKVFGSSIFNNSNLTFEPNLRIATPRNYTIGPADELLIDVYGYQEVNYKLTVSPEGTIVIPYVGVIPVSGITIEQASRRIRERMIRNGYASLSSGQSKLDVNVGKIKSIRVTIIGEAKRPGTYTLSALSSMFNALYAAGGISDQGSFRNIVLVRNNRVVDTLDAYDFLLRGDLSNNKGLMDQDVIQVPVAKMQVEIEGEVKRPGIYELLPRENMNHLIDFAGGFTNEAYTAIVHVQQVTDRERSLKDIPFAEFDEYIASRGDVVKVEKILDRFANRVTITGAVMRPGAYELSTGLTLAGLIQKADGLRRDAFKQRGLLTRTKENLELEIIPFNLNEVVAGSLADLVLKPEDQVTIASIFDYQENYTITIGGEVRNPGDYTWIENISLKDLLFKAGGFTDAAAPQQIEIARRISTDTLHQSTNVIAQVIDIASEKDLTTKGTDVHLEPWDIVMVRSKIGYKPQAAVQIEGEVQYPGSYILRSKQERVSDLIQRAGGLTPEAFKNGAYLTRMRNTSETNNVNLLRIRRIQANLNDTANTLLADASNPVIKMGLNLEEILKDPHSREDVYLQEGDVLHINKEVTEVKINGEVMFPTQVVYKKGADLLYYINKAGGFTEDAIKHKTYVLYANGNAAKSRNYLLFKDYPKPKPGAEILVPKRPERMRQRLTTGELVGITSGLATMLTLILTMIRL